MIARTIDTPDFVEGVALQGDFLYLAAGPSGLLVVDAADPHLPTIVGSVTQSGYSFDVAVSGSFAYVAHSGFIVIDLSKPDTPVIVGRLAAQGAHSVAITGGYVYVSRQSDVLVVDVANPAMPQVVATIPSAGGKITFDGDLAYVGGSRYLEVFDISNPTLPQSVGRLGVGVEVEESVILDSHAFVAAGWVGLLAVDISNPKPSPVFGVGPMAGAGNFAYADGYLYAAVGYDGMRVIDISNPNSPVVVGALDASWVRGIRWRA